MNTLIAQYLYTKLPPIFEDKFHFYFSYLNDSNKLAKGIGKFGRAATSIPRTNVSIYMHACVICTFLNKTMTSALLPPILQGASSNNTCVVVYASVCRHERARSPFSPLMQLVL